MNSWMNYRVEDPEEGQIWNPDLEEVKKKLKYGGYCIVTAGFLGCFVAGLLAGESMWLEAIAMFLMSECFIFGGSRIKRAASYM